MEKMISCKNCGEKVRPDEERCPYCNAKLEVDYAKLYQAYPNKKYYLQVANTAKGMLPTVIIIASVSVMFFTLGMCIAVLADSALEYVLVSLSFLLAVLLAVPVIQVWFCYMTWDGGDIITVRYGRKTERFTLSSVKLVSTEISYISQKMSANHRARSGYFAVVSKDDSVLFLIIKGKAIKNFFMHFGIPIYSHIDGANDKE